MRFKDGFGDVRVGVEDGAEVRTLDVRSIAELLQLEAAEIRRLVSEAPTAAIPWEAVELLPPVDGRTEVWGAGVTYQKSRTARTEESSFDRVYIEVYDADRPELFFKAPAWRVLGDGDVAGLRPDCTDSVPEPELALVVNAHQEIVGALVCNDLTSRSVEAVNPIYLPQAKTYTGSCVVSSGIVPWWLIESPEDLLIGMTIHRGDDIVFTGSARTSTMRRSYDELVRWLYTCTEFPDGAVLSTGTGVVPPLGEGLRSGDVVAIEVEQVGTLTNTVSADARLIGSVQRR